MVDSVKGKKSEGLCYNLGSAQPKIAPVTCSRC